MNHSDTITATITAKMINAQMLTLIREQIPEAQLSLKRLGYMAAYDHPDAKLTLDATSLAFLCHYIRQQLKIENGIDDTDEPKPDVRSFSEAAGFGKLVQFPAS